MSSNESNTHDGWQAQADARCAPTARRVAAVELLISRGYTWQGGAWVAPAKPEAVRLRDELRERAGFDVTSHQLVTMRLASINDLERAQNADQYKASMRKQIGDDIGDAIVSRYPETWTPESRSPKVTLRHEVFVFSPEELAALIAATGKQQVGDIPTMDAGLAAWLTARGLMPDADEHGCVEMDDVIEALNEHERQLAPEQQVGEVQTVNADEAPFGLTTAEKVAWARGANDAIQEYAARHSVGHEPLCFIHPREADMLRAREFTLRSTAPYWERPGHDAVPVYLGQPAQAVGLGQLRKGIEALRVYSGGYYLRRDAVLALIDSHQTG